jgi:chromate transporter
MTTAPQKPTFQEAFRFWLKLGFISFGGPAGQIAIMHEFLVEKKRWISDSRFLHALNYCMVLPGPEAQQLATYIGWLLHGVRGGLTAGILFILPSMLILLALSVVYVSFGTLDWVASVFYGLKPAVVVIVILAIIRIGKKSLLTTFHTSIAVFAFVAIFFFKISFPLIILVAVAIGFMARRWFPSLFRASGDSSSSTRDESAYFLNASSPPITQGLSWKSVGAKTLFACVLWMLPITAFYFLSAQYGFWWQLSFFFTKAAFVTFGGAYAVLPYVAQEAVEKLHWLSQGEMIDGLALGETTPGPLIMVLVFVGFMAGYHHYAGSLWGGTLGLVITTFFTFLPCFFLILVGAPLVERTQGNQHLRSVLAIVTASVVGVMLNLAIFFGKAVLFLPGTWSPDWPSVVWLIISFAALYRFKVNMIVWLLVSATAGVLHHLLA